MEARSVPVLLVTANVGSIFENPTAMFDKWTSEFLTKIEKLEPKFVALHCQEVGGKNYENSMKHVECFVTTLIESPQLQPFNKIQVFLDEDYTSVPNFTALGNFYFIHESLKNVEIWNFKDLKFVPCEGLNIHINNIEEVETKEKAKFAKNFFPQFKWSRKGFLRTRWCIDGTVFDLVNIHLFHDASNIVAMEGFPSVYCENRRLALEDTLKRFHNDEYEKAPYFLFGDLNFRTDTKGVVNKLTEGLNVGRIPEGDDEVTKWQFTDSDNKLIMTVGKKEFQHEDHQELFLNSTDDKWLHSFDRELEAFKEHLYEFPINFPPSYPFEESVTLANTYMQTRCPSWCDRVLLSHTARHLVDEDRPIIYDLMGRETCMGDHKPVYLNVSLLLRSGIIKCCEHARFECLPKTCPCCRSYAVTIHVTDMSDGDMMHQLRHAGADDKAALRRHQRIDYNATLLHEPDNLAAYDPYTPESADSRSPLPETSQKMNSSKRTVSPSQLRRRLELFLRESTGRANMIRSVSHQVGVNLNHDESYRKRAMSEATRVKVNSSLLRLQSHHSSSDEEWYEFQTNKDAIEEDDSAGGGGDEVVVTVLNNKVDKHQREDQKSKKCCCCCVS